jgi:hypothetical protein
MADVKGCGHTLNFKKLPPTSFRGGFKNKAENVFISTDLMRV